MKMRVGLRRVEVSMGWSVNGLKRLGTFQRRVLYLSCLSFVTGWTTVTTLQKENGAVNSAMYK